MMKVSTMLPFFLIVLVIFSLGCTEFGFFDSIQGLSSKEQTEKQVADVVTIESIRAFPMSPVFAGRDFKLYVTVKNNDKKRIVDYILAEIYDPSVFEVKETSKAIGSLLPLGQAVVVFDMTAPKADRIANVETEGIVSVRVKYLFQSETTFDIVAVNEQEITRHQQAGENIELLSTKLIGSGPVRIYPEIVGSEKSILIGTSSGSVDFTLKNEGRGFVEDGQIQKGWLAIDFPSELTVSTEYIAGGAKTTTTTIGGHVTSTTVTPVLPCISGANKINGESCGCAAECASGLCWNKESSSYQCQPRQGDCYDENEGDSFVFAPSNDVYVTIYEVEGNTNCYNDCKYDGVKCVPMLKGDNQPCSSSSECKSGRCWSEQSTGGYICQSNCAPCHGYPPTTNAPDSGSCCPDCVFENSKCMVQGSATQQQNLKGAEELCTKTSECKSGLKCWGYSDSLFRCKSSDATTGLFAPDAIGCSPLSYTSATKKCGSSTGSPSGSAISSMSSIISGQAVAVGLPLNIFPDISRYLDTANPFAPTGNAIITGMETKYECNVDKYGNVISGNCNFGSCSDFNDGSQQGGCMYQCCLKNGGKNMYLGGECTDMNTGGGSMMGAGECYIWNHNNQPSQYSDASCLHSKVHIGTITDKIGSKCDCWCWMIEPCKCWEGGSEPCSASACGSGSSGWGGGVGGSGGGTTTTTTGGGGGGSSGTTTKTTKTTVTTTPTTIPISVNPPGEQSKDVFTQVGNFFSNRASTIKIMGKESIPFIFYVAAPETDTYRTFTIHAKVKYVYEIRDTAKIRIRPLATP